MKTEELKDLIMRIADVLPYTPQERERYSLLRCKWSHGRLQFFCDRLAEAMATSSITLQRWDNRGNRCWTVVYSPWGITEPGERGWYRTPLEAMNGIIGLLELAKVLML